MGTIEEAGRLCLCLAAGATFAAGVDHILSGGAELAYGRKTCKDQWEGFLIRRTLERGPIGCRASFFTDRAVF